MVEQLLDFLREQRHIFGSCPHCQAVFRLSNAKVSYSAYKPDWMDKIEDQNAKEVEKLAVFQEESKKLREQAIARERKTKLPKLLNKAVPMFASRKLFPQDVKTLFDPIDFVVFDGMNNEDLVKRVLLMDNKAETSREKALHQSIQETIDSKALTWKTVQIDKDGKIALE
jgi:predicted Holliday junction resolvase-like endonuclease